MERRWLAVNVLEAIDLLEEIVAGAADGRAAAADVIVGAAGAVDGPVVAVDVIEGAAGLAGDGTRNFLLRICTDRTKATARAVVFFARLGLSTYGVSLKMTPAFVVPPVVVVPYRFPVLSKITPPAGPAPSCPRKRCNTVYFPCGSNLNTAP